MALIIFFIAAGIEIGLAVYSIVTKSKGKKIRNWIRIGASAIFLLFTLVSVIEWSFRWYLPAVVLVIWTVTGVVSLIRKKADKKKYSAVPTVIKAAGMLIIFSIALVPAFIFPQYRPPAVTGQYKVDTAVYTYTDDNRIETFTDTGEKRKVTVQFWYPANGDKTYPLVVFSHGAFGVRVSNTSTFMELASNGYVVCSVDHPYHSLYNIDTGGKLTIVDRSFMEEIEDVNNDVFDEETKFSLEQKWMKLRTQDINFVLNTIVNNTRNGSGKVYGRINTDRIGLLGHSLGGAASIELGREREDVDSVINLDGDMLGEATGYADGRYIINRKIYPVPLLNIYTDDMKRLLDSAANSSIELPQKLISETAPQAYDMYIAGTNHMSLTDLPLFSPLLVKLLSGTTDKMSSEQKADKYAVIEKMNSTVLQFFDCYLKDKGSFHTP